MVSTSCNIVPIRFIVSRSKFIDVNLSFYNLAILVEKQYDSYLLKYLTWNVFKHHLGYIFILLLIEINKIQLISKIVT